MDEFALIAHFFAPLAAAEPGAFGLTDDAAVLALGSDQALVATIDTLVEGVHFRAEDPPESVGVKLLAVNLSDLAAMAARPRGYLLSLALPAAWAMDRREAWLGGFVAGLRAAQAQAGVDLVGGDTVGTPGPLTLTVTALGTVTHGQAVRRSGAQVGDDVYVSGSIGDAALGLMLLQGRLTGASAADGSLLIERYQRPTPRLGVGRGLSGLAHAAADVSDGLIADLGHICQASGVGATIESQRIPLSAPASAVLKRDPDVFMDLLRGGDDYELVFTAAPERAADVARLAAATGVPLTAIGKIARPHIAQDAHSVRVTDPSGRDLVVVGSGGYCHFT